ncbi:MAG: hypothetical protein ACOC8B_01805, partial [Gemmatimonadota bacterium]
MRSLPVLCLLLAPLAGCAPLAGPADSGPYATRAMHAWLMPDRHMGFAAGAAYTAYTSHPAHVALFEVVPGRGTGLIYPSDGWHEPRVSAGLHRIIDIVPSHRWAYQPTPPIRPAAYTMGPRYLVLIASELPLRLEAIRETSYALRRALGFQTFVGYRPYDTIEAILATVLPAQHPAGWDVDIVPIWPQLHGLPRARLARVMCAGSGQVFMVPTDFLRLARVTCGTPLPNRYDGERVAVNTDAGSGTDDQTGDDDGDRTGDRSAAVPGPGIDDPSLVTGPTMDAPRTRVVADAAAGPRIDGPGFWKPTLRPVPSPSLGDDGELRLPEDEHTRVGPPARDRSREPFDVWPPDMHRPTSSWSGTRSTSARSLPSSSA